MPPHSLLLSCFLICSLVSGSIAFDITKILNQYSDYAVFNQELSKTHVASEINKRKSVTVLVVPNGAMSGVTSMKDDKLENIMRIHVILDYYDSAKIKKIKDGTTMTTLYQTTGSADKKQGFVKISKNDNEIKLGSAVDGAQMSAKVNKVVTSVPSDISVIEISSPIVPPGLDGSSSPPTSSPTPSPSRSSDSSPSSSPSPSSSESPAADDSSDDKDAPAPSPKKHSHAHAPAPSHKKHDKHKHAHAPAPSDDDADADADGDDADADEDADADDEDDDEDDRTADEDDDSSSSRNAVVSSIMLLASVVATL